MVRKLLVSAVLLAVSAPALAQEAQEKTYEVRVQGSPRQVRIEFRTLQDQPQMCALRPSLLDLEVPMIDPDTGVAVGASIFAETMVDGDVCLQAFGPHSGDIVFDKGPELPRMRQGRYHFFLDGEYYGVIRVTQNGAQLIPADDREAPPAER